MSQRKLSKEYVDTMLKANKAVDRKEAVSLLHKADSIRKKLRVVDNHLVKQLDIN